jgi:sulfur-carrier protein
MSVKVKIPTQLRNLTGGESEVQVAGSTLNDVVTELEQKHPGFKERILDESGTVRRFVNVYVNDEDVRFLDGLSTSVSEGATVSIIPAVAGG